MTLLETVARAETIDRGEFNCPHCKRLRQYAHIRVASYLCVLKVSLYQNGVLSDYIECQTCHRQFAPDGLNSEEIALVLPHQVKAA